VILLVDDDAAHRHLLRAQLAELGAEIAEAPDAPSALAAVRVLRPRVVLLDWVMPGGGGLSVARIVSEEVGLADVAVIMVTALHDPRDAKLAHDAGVVGYLTKPVPGDTLRAVVRKAMAGGMRGRSAVGSVGE
jgi:two-component system phosphate regulon response regulator PhoB